MADKITVELASPDFNLPTANKTTIALYDDPGPLNGWEPLVAGSIAAGSAWARCSSCWTSTSTIPRFVFRARRKTRIQAISPRDDVNGKSPRSNSAAVPRCKAACATSRD
jgi:hypothetical protein